MGLKQERVRKVRGKAVGCQDMCDGGCTRPGVRSPQVQCPPSRACQTRAGSPGLRAACRTRLGRSQRQQSGADSKGSQAPLMGCLSPWGLESHLRVSQSPQHSSQSGPPTLLQGLSRARINVAGTAQFKRALCLTQLGPCRTNNTGLAPPSWPSPLTFPCGITGSPKVAGPALQPPYGFSEVGAERWVNARCAPQGREW